MNTHSGMGRSGSVPGGFADYRAEDGYTRVRRRRVQESARGGGDSGPCVARAVALSVHAGRIPRR